MRKKVAKSSGRTIDIRDVERPLEPQEFAVKQIQETSELEEEFESEPVSIPIEPSEKVRVKFEKFVQLIATHNFQEVLKKNPEEDVILSTNLLADLANAHEEPKGERKVPVALSIGILIGVALTYLLFKL